MGKRLTTEYVRGKVEERGWTFDDDEYLGNNIPFNYTCDRGHKRRMVWRHFQSGEGCIECYEIERQEDMFKLVKASFEEYGWKLRDDKYINSYTDLDCICSNGHECSITWGYFQQYHTCYVCNENERRKKVFVVVKNAFEDRGYILKSTEYVNAKIKLDYVCPNGHSGSISWDGFKHGNGCQVCAGNTVHSIGYARRCFEVCGCVLKSTEYINGQTKLDYICSNGHAHSISLLSFLSGHGCPLCAVMNNSGPKHYKWKGGAKDPYCPIWTDKEYRKDILERDNYKCQNPYCYGKCPNDLVRHHIEYDKMKCAPKDIITLCRGCNIRVEDDPGFHTLYFQTLMNKKYGYVY